LTMSPFSIARSEPYGLDIGGNPSAVRPPLSAQETSNKAAKPSTGKSCPLIV